MTVESYKYLRKLEIENYKSSRKTEKENDMSSTKPFCNETSLIGFLKSMQILLSPTVCPTPIPVRSSAGLLGTDIGVSIREIPFSFPDSTPQPSEGNSAP